MSGRKEKTVYGGVMNSKYIFVLFLTLGLLTSPKIQAGDELNTITDKKAICSKNSIMAMALSRKRSTTCLQIKK
jgi:hypothetical protein